MRTIKFRGKRVDNGEWVYGNLITSSNGYAFIDTNNELYEDDPYLFRDNTDIIRVAVSKVDENSVGQFTGLFDKNDKEIYEGDIITSDGVHTRTIEWNSYQCKFNAVEYGIHTAIILGNIHTNPELLNPDSE